MLYQKLFELTFLLVHFLGCDKCLKPDVMAIYQKDIFVK
jgi:hypothetical protein